MAEEIVTKIVLSGAPEVVAGFGAIGEAGRKAFDAIANSAQSLGSIGGFLGVFGGLAAAASGLTVAMFALSKSSAETVNEISKLARQVGVSTEDMTAISVVMTRGVADADGLGAAFKRLAVRVDSTWSQIRKSVNDAARGARADQLAIESATLNLGKANVTVANQERDAALLRVSNALSVRSATMSLAEAVKNLQRVRGEEVDSGQTEQELAEQKAVLAVQQARLAQEEAIKKQKDDAENAARQIEANRLAREQAALALDQARAKQREDQANSIETLVKHVDNLSKGIKDAGLNVNATSENIFKGLVASVGFTSGALETLKGDLSNLGTAAPNQLSILKKLADVMKNSGDQALNTALAMRVFGRSVGPETVQRLSEGGNAIEETAARLRSLGLVFTSIKEQGEKSDEFIAKQFRKTLAELKSDLNIITTRFGLSFGNVFINSLKLIDETLVKNQASIVALGRTIADIVQPIIESFVRVLLGVPEAGKDDWARSYVQRLNEFGSAVSTVAGLVVKGFQAIVAATRLVAQAFNGLFGTDLNATEILIGAWVLKILGGFALLRVGATALIGFFVGFFSELATIFGAGAVTAFVAPLVLAFGLAIAAANIFKKELTNLIDDFSKLGTPAQTSTTIFDFLFGRNALAVLQQNVQRSMELIAAFSKASQGRFAEAAELIFNGPSLKLKEQIDADARAQEEALGKTKKAADDTSTSIWERFKTNLDNVKKEFASTFGGDAKKSLDSVGNTADKAASGVSDISTQARRATADLKQTAETWDSAFNKNRPDITDPESGPLGAGKGIGQIARAQIATGEIARGLDEVKAKVDDVGSAIRKVSQESSKIINVDEALSALKSVQTETDSLGNTIRKVSGIKIIDISDTLRGQILGVSEAITQTAQKVQEMSQTNPVPWVPEFTQAFSTVQQNIQQTDQEITKLSDTGPIDALKGAMEAFGQSVEQDTQKVRELLETLKQLSTVQLPQVSGGGGGGGGGGFAGGGQIRGPGTTTSDSILAFVSKDEWIIQAQAVAALVRRFGGGVMHAINNFHQLGALPGLALGGFAGAFAGGGVPLPSLSLAGAHQLRPRALQGPVPVVVRLPAMAKGGQGLPVTGGKLTLDVNINGQRAGTSTHTLEEIQAGSARAHVNSMGPRSSWYKGR